MPVSALLATLSPDLLAHPLSAGPAPPDAWAVCPACLAQDVEEGRPPYVRATWTHPLTTHCQVHTRPLISHAASSIKVADDEMVFDRHPERPARWDALGERPFDNPGVVARVASGLRQREKGRSEWLKLRFAIRDIVDGLGTLTRGVHPRALMNHFEEPLFGRRSLIGALRLPVGWMAEMDATTRLLYVRVALFVLAEPPDPSSADVGPLGAVWLRDLYAHSRPRGWEARFKHAIRDPLLLFATQLPRETILALDERSLAWPADLRRRWTYAAAAGAIGGYVF